MVSVDTFVREDRESPTFLIDLKKVRVMVISLPPAVGETIKLRYLLGKC